MIARTAGRREGDVVRRLTPGRVAPAIAALAFWAAGGVCLASPGSHAGRSETPRARVASVTAVPINEAGNAQGRPRVATSLQSGEHLVVWEHVYSETDHDIYAQRLGSDGSLVGGVIAIAAGGAFEASPAVAWGSQDNEFLVAWEVDLGASGRDIRARRVGADGSLIGGAVDVAVLAGGDTTPDLAFNPLVGEYLVVWQRETASGELIVRSVFGRRLSAGGALLGGLLEIAAGGGASAPSVACSAVGGVYLVAWQGAGASDVDIQARMLAGDGSPMGSVLGLSTWEYDQVKPRVAHNPDADEFLVVWEDHHWGWGEDWDIYGRRVRGDGEPAGDSFGISWDAPNARTNPAVAYSQTSREYQVTWEYEVVRLDHDVVRRRVAPDGSLPGAEQPVSDLDAYEGRPAVAADSAYGFLFVWEDNRSWATTGLDIYGDVAHQFLLSGRVLRGEMGDESHPIPGVTVELHCSNDHGVVGGLVGSTLTGVDGTYGLAVPGVCEYYAVVEVNPPDHTSVGAVSPSGEVLDPDTIQLSHPLIGKTLTGNLFWDTAPEDPAPGGWASFTPTAWVTASHTVTCTVQVQDVGSGLDMSTAAFSFTRDGTYWSDWQGASCTGSDGSLGPETLTATNVPFFQDSGATDVNRIHFRIADMGGNLGTSGDYLVPIDTTPPDNPAGITVDRPPSTWSSDSTATVTWPHGTDATSGVAGYSFQWSSAPDTLPDQVVDDVDNHIEDTVIPGEGTSWYFHVRTVDHAGNWAAEAVHAGPYFLDLTPPSGAGTLTSPTHQVSIWSSSNQVSVQWTGGTDGASGVAGYSFVWDHALLTAPDTVVDTVMTSVGSGPRADGSWYFHIRTVDNAGNGSVASHMGPFNIDTTPPSSAVNALAPFQGGTSFTVSWSGDAGGGASIVSYDVRVTDQFGSSTTTTTWRSATAATSDTFVGQRGHLYTFASRALDGVGNLEPYPLAGGDAQTQVGRKVLVRVRKESAAACKDARVYHGNVFMGTTDAAGTLLTWDFALHGDTLAALCPVYEHPSPKGAHNLGSPTNQNWAWRAYQSSVAVDNTGTTTQFTVTDLNNAYQDLTVRQHQSVIGFHVLVSVEWDASSTFLDDLKTGLEGASTYLYDGGDSQLFWETVEVDDAAAYWNAADIRVHASNQVWPNASVGGLNQGEDKHIYVGRYFNGNSSNTGNWSLSNGFRTFIHEFGHYMGLWDEYLDRDGNKTANAFCATNFATTPVDIRASIMYYQYTATEFCSRVNAGHKHRSETQHDEKTGGESCWESLKRFFSDGSNPKRWTIRTPDDRGQIMAGPTALPVAVWQDTSVANHTQAACAPYDIGVVWQDSGLPAPGVDVWVKRAPPLHHLYQGKTDKNGVITILGARNGDTEFLDNDGASSSYSVACTPGPLRLATPIVLTPDAFKVTGLLVPLDPTTIQVSARASVALAGAPAATLWQGGAASPVTVALAWDAPSASYLGQATLDPAQDRSGYLALVATDQAAHTVQAVRRFRFEPVLAAGENPKLYSQDGKLEIVLPAGSLTGDGFVVIQDVNVGSRQQGSLRRVGSAYRVALSTGQTALAVPAVVKVFYDAEQAADVVVDTLRLHHWDEGALQWVEDGGEVDPAYSILSAQVSHLSVFALLGQRSCTAVGDANGDCQVGVGDVFYLINTLFAGGPAPIGSADCNHDGQVNVQDVFHLINYLFAGGPAPVD